MSRLSLFLMGGFEARLDETPVSGFKTDKSRALLAYLAVEQARPHRRQALAGLFWPGYLESSARASLRHALANLRQALADEGEIQSLNNRHSDYYLWLAEQAEPQLKSAERITWTYKLIREFHNMHQALEWSFGQGDPHAGVHIINALTRRFWQPAGYDIYRSYWVGKGIDFALGNPGTPKLTLVCLYNNSFQNSEWIDKAIALCEQIGPQADAELCFALAGKVIDAYNLMNKAALHRYAEQCLEVARRLGPADTWMKAWALTLIGMGYSMCLEEHNAACQFAMEGWQLFQQVGDRWMVSYLFVLGYAAESERNYQKARQYYQEAYAVHKEVNDTNGMIVSLMYIGNLELAADPLNAKSYYRELSKLFYDINRSVVPVALRALGVIEVMHCQALPPGERKAYLLRAARLFGAEEVSGLVHITLKYYQAALELLRGQLDPDELAAAWAEGAAMPAEELYRYALEEERDHPLFPGAQASPA